MFSWDAVRNAPHLSIYTPDVRWDEVIARYDQFYGAFDPRRRFVEQARIGQFVNCDEHLSEQDVSRSEFFQDFQIPAGFRYLMGVRLARPNSDEIFLGLLRARDRTPYTQEERAAAAGMAGHLQRAINLWQDARVLHRDAALGTELMEQLGLAVFALDRHSRVVFVNAAAESALRATTSLRLEHGRWLRPRQPITSACKRPSGAWQNPPGREPGAARHIWRTAGHLPQHHRAPRQGHARGVWRCHHADHSQAARHNRPGDRAAVAASVRIVCGGSGGCRSADFGQDG